MHQPTAGLLLFLSHIITCLQVHQKYVESEASAPRRHQTHLWVIQCEPLSRAARSVIFVICKETFSRNEGLRENCDTNDKQDSFAIILRIQSWICNRRAHKQSKCSKHGICIYDSEPPLAKEECCPHPPSVTGRRKVAA